MALWNHSLNLHFSRSALVRWKPSKQDCIMPHNWVCVMLLLFLTFLTFAVAETFMDLHHVSARVTVFPGGLQHLSPSFIMHTYKLTCTCKYVNIQSTHHLSSSITHYLPFSDWLRMSSVCSFSQLCLHIFWLKLLALTKRVSEWNWKRRFHLLQLQYVLGSDVKI